MPLTHTVLGQLACLLCFAHVLTSSSASANPLAVSKDIYSTEARSSDEATPNDIALALVYGYPLALYVQTFYPVIEANGVNVPKNDNTTATAGHSSLVRPNANYVYSPMAVDLSHDNVVITLPEIGDGRSYVYAIYDLYGNNFANLGSVTSSPPGDYLLRPAGSRPAGLTMLGASDPCGYKGIVDYATIYGSMEIRILLRNNGSDLETVHRYQNETHTKMLRRDGAPLGPHLTTSLLDNGTLASAAYSAPNDLDYANATAVLSLLAKLAPYNPPQNRALTGEVDAMLSRAGISDGHYNSAVNFNLTAVNDILTANFTRESTPTSGHWDNFGNGWYQPKRYESGDFHTAYLERASIAYIGYLELVQKQSLYPEFYGPEDNAEGLLTLAANESLIFTFSSRPPAQFWSLTVYGSNNYLITNPLDRYNLAPTSGSLTYPNGTKVYPTGQHDSQYYLNPKDYAPFQILIQPSDVSPPANWTGNWIPSQAGGGGFTVNFRTYGPAKALTNGSYVYPVVTKEAALR